MYVGSNLLARREAIGDDEQAVFSITLADAV